MGEQKANINAAAELRRQVESALAGRISSALTYRPPVSPELLSCGLTEVDAVLGGGLPLGAITELTAFILPVKRPSYSQRWPGLPGWVRAARTWMSPTL